MKTKWAMIGMLAAALVGFTGCSQSVKTGAEQMEAQPNGGQAVQYTCPMHPEVVQNKPGKCPKCGMDLVAK